MLNLPYSVDVVQLTIQQGAYIGYDYSGPIDGSLLPDNIDGGALPDDFILPQGKVYYSRRGSIYFANKSASGSTLPVIPAGTISVIIQGTQAGERYRDLFRASWFPSENYVRIEPIDTTVVPAGEPFTLIPLPYNNNSILVPFSNGKFIKTIPCFTSQLARSLDEFYTERYMVITSEKFDQNRRDLYLVANGHKNGFPDRWTGSKVERIQSFDTFSQIIVDTYPPSVADAFIAQETFNYTDGAGIERSIEVPYLL